MTASAWIKRPRPRPEARARVFCVPHAGAGPSSYAHWVSELPEDVELCLVHLPGREARLTELPLDDITAIAQRVGRACADLLDLPFVLLGHSMGALVAYETARRLTVAPRRLFVSACPPAHRLVEEPPVAHLPDDEFLAEVRRAYQGIPDEVWSDRALMRMMLPALRADFAAYETYEWVRRDPLTCPVTALGGSTDALVPTASLAGWAELTEAPCEVEVFDGGHFYLTEARHEVQRMVTAALRTDVARPETHPETAGAGRTRGAGA
ncbi:alpha/beta fold hydrolase [Streptomyces flaveolus]|uniref:thioesterase II family protein n=1 Tax=Streptomyces flaveolus TaxID=67297 RepID=UPI0033193EC9